MADVIGLEETKRRKQKKIDQDGARKALALLKVFECASCYLKCARCGMRLELSQIPAVVSNIPYRFCETCHEEFGEFQRRVRGGRKKDFYWYNEEWVNMWKAWTSYQEAVRGFLNSREVLRLRYELKRG